MMYIVSMNSSKIWFSEYASKAPSTLMSYHTYRYEKSFSCFLLIRLNSYRYEIKLLKLPNFSIFLRMGRSDGLSSSLRS